MQLLLVLLHILGAIVFMGNLVVSGLWMAEARRTRDTAVLHFAVRAVIRADWTVTVPGVFLILFPGVLAVAHWGGFGRTAWAELGLVLFLFSGIIWAAVLIPCQRRMQRLSAEALASRSALGDDFYGALQRWFAWGGAATLLPALALYLMVYKPALWNQ